MKTFCSGKLKVFGSSNMKFLVIVNENPTTSGAAQFAQRFVRSSIHCGHEVSAVFFQGQGIFNAFQGIENPLEQDSASGWQEIAESGNTALLLCSAAMARNKGILPVADPAPVYRVSSLSHMWDLAMKCDRLVSF